MGLIDTIAGRTRAGAQTGRRPRRHLLIAVSTAAAAGAAVWAGGLPNRDRFDQLITIVAGVVFVLLSGASLRTVADRLSGPVTVRAGASAAHLVRMGLTAVGYLLVMFIALVLMRIPVGQLLLSGAVTGVILGIAAQQTLGDAFAGIILMTSAPFRVGSTSRYAPEPSAASMTGTLRTSP